MKRRGFFESVAAMSCAPAVVPACEPVVGTYVASVLGAQRAKDDAIMAVFQENFYRIIDDMLAEIPPWSPLQDDMSLEEVHDALETNGKNLADRYALCGRKP